MDEHEELARRFEEHRDHLRAVAYRLLGSAAEADDAVQEAWLRLHRTGVADVRNLGGWLTTVVARICLDQLRARAARPERSMGWPPVGPDRSPPGGVDPAAEAELADAVGRALTVVLARLGPAERVAFVLHDVFAVPFAEIGPVLARTPAAAKKLAGRARLKVRGAPDLPPAELARDQRVVEAFLAAARRGDLDGLLAVLAPDVVRRADPAVLPAGAAAVVRGARAVAEETRALSAERARNAEPALVDGAVGAVVVRAGRLELALRFTVTDDRVAAFEVVADPVRLAGLTLAVAAG
jgi:RNA polymerase sigma-70 factor (ECF subfamily)